MRVQHLSEYGSCSREISEEVACFLRSTTGWFSQFTTRQTRYEGLFLRNVTTIPHRFIKVLERIEVAPSETIQQIIVDKQTCTYRYSNNLKLTYYLASSKAEAVSLLVEGNTACELIVNLDTRDIYTYPQFERHYHISTEAEGTLLTYRDPALPQPFYLFFADCHPSGEAYWQEVHYPRDAARSSGPTELYTYRLSFQTALLRCGASWDLATARQAATSLPKTAPAGNQKAAEQVASPLEIARAGATRALYHLQSDEGYYAGLPWFHQVWSRDELLAGLGLEPKAQLELINRYLSFHLENGELPTYKGSGTTCADGLTWFLLLVREYGLANLPQSVQSTLGKFLKDAHAGLSQYRRTPSGLIWSQHNATWMDTIGRTGFRLEIQCGFALLLELLSSLYPQEAPEYKKAQEELLATIRHHLFQNGYLYDGLEDDQTPDPRKRPNVFLAYLLQSNLLTLEEWTSCFNIVVKATRTSWGGLSSLDQADPAFSPLSTGENNISYHQGDSWFFINNLTALTLTRFNQSYYQHDIDHLTTASTNEILWQHFLGYPGEIASSQNGASWGCGMQAFSAGTYLALTRNMQ